MIEKLALVALGGALGAVCRFATVLWAGRVFGAGFPWGTAAVNVLGSCVMGVLAVLLIERLPAGTRWIPFLMTGVLGGFTTFSAFSLDAIQLLERARYGAAAGYIGASVLLSIAGLWTGMSLARMAAA